MMRSRFLSAMLGAGLTFLMAPLASRAQDCDPNAGTANLDFVVEDMNGKEIALTDYRGQVILLDFWATWCAPCRIEMPWFAEFFDEYEDQGFVVLAFNVDDDVPAIQSFADRYGMDFPVLVGVGRDDLMDAYGPPVGYPTGVLIGRDGNICRVHTGYTEKSTFESEIEALL